MSIVRVLPEHGLARAAAAQLALDLDLVVDAELDLELLAGGDRVQAGLPDELLAVEDPGLAGQQQERPVADRRAQVSLRGQHRDGQVVQARAQFRLGHQGLVRAAVARHRERAGHRVHEAGTGLAPARRGREHLGLGAGRPERHRRAADRPAEHAVGFGPGGLGAPGADLAIAECTRGGWGRPMYQGLSSGSVCRSPCRVVDSTSVTSGQSSPVCWVISAR